MSFPNINNAKCRFCGGYNTSVVHKGVRMCIKCREKRIMKRSI